MIFIDLKKALDTVDHQILLDKIQHYGVDSLAHQWFSSYLHNRRRCCKVNYVQWRRQGGQGGGRSPPMLKKMALVILPNSMRKLGGGCISISDMKKS